MIFLIEFLHIAIVLVCLAELIIARDHACILRRLGLSGIALWSLGNSLGTVFYRPFQAEVSSSIFVSLSILLAVLGSTLAELRRQKKSAGSERP
jgi:membrane protein implicated in regulation of membrane protease activity